MHFKASRTVLSAPLECPFYQDSNLHSYCIKLGADLDSGLILDIGGTLDLDRSIQRTLDHLLVGGHIIMDMVSEFL